MSWEVEQYLTKEQKLAIKKAVKCQNDNDLEIIFNAECVGRLDYKIFNQEGLWLWVGLNHKIVVLDLGNGNCRIISVFPIIRDLIHNWGVLDKHGKWLIYMVPEKTARNIWKNNKESWRLVNEIKTNENMKGYHIIEEKPNVY